ncbi:MAG: DUF1800 domain-containing protein [Planctomycetes bacterium]|nr:DUF1800 domain-containing protein [Planctomycetota bacterium]
MKLHTILLASLVLAPSGLGRPQEPAAAEQRASAFEWGPRQAEHLFNRAGFGARPNEIGYALRMPHTDFVEQLLKGFAEGGDPFFVEPLARPARREFEGDEDAYRKALERYRREERALLVGYSGWWVDQMIDGKDPLREKMVLFWHGYFTSSARDVKSATAMVRQNELFHRHALGNFRELLRAIVRDPAMIEYLDNNQNRKGNPNENLAREIMELFTLGEGHYTEDDIKEGARALTGWRTNDDKTDAYFVSRQHDSGVKTILGRKGKFDADDFVDILLDQPACPRWIARRLLAYFEGAEPSEERLAEYAACLRAERFEVAPFLRKLFLDPRFYRDEILGERISSPVEYLVGTTRRLGVEVPAQLLWLAAGQLGQRLFDPPNVKGWEGGEAWITTSTLLARGNMAGMLIGVVKFEDVLKDESFDVGDGEDSMMGGDAMSGDSPSGAATGAGTARPKRDAKREAKPDLGPEMGALKRLTGEFYYPRINLSARATRLGVSRDGALIEALCDELLPVPLSETSRIALLDFLRAERGALMLEDGKLLSAGAKAEDVLRRLAHLILSLPEAQLG